MVSIKIAHRKYLASAIFWYYIYEHSMDMGLIRAVLSLCL